MRALPLILLAMTLGQDSPAATAASPPPPSFDPRIRDIVDSISAERIEADIRKLAGFGTRHTMSETESDTRGIGAARRWIQAEFERISEDCGGCLEVSSQATLVEADGPSRQLARYVARVSELYVSNLDAIMIYRLDRFGRGGHHRPFNDEGFPAVRIMETHENYNRQHQDIRVENIIIDNYLFGVASVAKDGNESPVVFPSGTIEGRR